MSWARQAVLFGGDADGFAVELDALHATVTVFRNGGPPFAVEGVVDANSEPNAVRLGVYELVEPVGPDTPVYVANRF